MTNTTISSGEMTLSFIEQGEGTPIILLHGLSSSRHEWDTAIPVLVGAGFRVFACDLLGHGESPKPIDAHQYQLETVYESLVAWIDSLQLKEPFFLGGHSLGGYFSLMVALRQPSRLRGLLLIDPFFELDQIPRLLQRQTRLLFAGEKILHTTPERVLVAMMNFPIIHSSVLPVKCRQQQAMDIRAADPNVALLFQSIPSLLLQVENIHLPALVVWGDHDRSCNPRSFPGLVERLPEAQELCLPGCGHHPHLEKPEEVFARMLKFLGETRDKG